MSLIIASALAVKKLMDITISLFMTVILSPVLLFIALAIKFTSPGPVIFKQPRVGIRGRMFNLYKFRTMVADAEKLKKELEAKNEVDGPVFKMKNDPRVTKIGGFLRKTGLDELPQLFNILKGEMSLIGPGRLFRRRQDFIKDGSSAGFQSNPDCRASGRSNPIVTASNSNSGWKWIWLI